MSLQARLLPAGQAPGFKVTDEFEWPQLKPALRDGITYVDREQATQEFTEAGYQGAAARVFAREKGDVAWVIAFEFADEDGAAAARDFVHAQDLEQCPRECVFTLAEFSVDGIPGALGASATPIQEGHGAQDGATHTIEFADGRFMYLVQRYAPPSESGPEDVTDLAQRVHERVEGAPAPDG